jgi:PAS domain S-box-containing protein
MSSTLSTDPRQTGGIFDSDAADFRARARENAFRAGLLEQLDDAIVAVDGDFRVTYWNRVAERLFGQSIEEVLGKDYGEAVHDMFELPERTRLRRQLLESGALKLELACRNGAGEALVVELSATLLHDEAGHPAGAVGIHRDVTARRRAEEALAASEGRFSLAQAALGIGTWEVDLKSGRVTSSLENRRLYGIDQDRPEFATLPAWHARTHPLDRDRAAREFQTRCLREACNREFRVVWPDGSVHWIFTRSNVLFDADHQPTRVLGMSIDITEQKQNEEQLRILSSAVEQSPVSIVLTDPKGDIQYANPKAVEVTGYTLEELVGRNPRILKSGETPPETYRELWETVANGVWRGVFHNRRKNGELFWESAAIGPVRDECGGVTHYLAVKEDITQRRAMEAALKLSEERFRLAAQSSGDLVYEWDLRSDRVQIFAGENTSITTDADGRPLSGSDFLARIHPDDRERVQAAMQRNWESGEPYQEEYRLVLPEGGVQYWSDSGSALRDAAGKPQRWVGVAKDVTLAKAAERTNAELAAIVASAETAIITRDLEGHVLTWNAGAERIYGYSAAEMVGNTFITTVPADRVAEIGDINARIKAGERVAHLETVRLTKGGARVEVLMSITPIRDRSGAVIGGAHVVWDISEIRRLQRQLAQAQKLESVGQLAAGIAHEINTPIQYIGDNALFLADAFRSLSRFLSPHAEIVDGLRHGPNPKLADSLDRIQTEADVDYLCREVPKAIGQLSEGVQQVARIVRAMKEFSHPSSSDMVMLDVNRAIESTILVCKNEWKYVAEMTTDLDPGLPPVPCLAGEFNLVVLNLIMNAAHAIADVVEGSGQKGAIRVGTRHQGPWAEIRVSDTGAGIPEAIQSKIFDPFFTTREVGKGTGQGLSIAHAVIVKKHGGTLSFETASGAGTTFLVQLPLTQPEGI